MGQRSEIVPPDVVPMCTEGSTVPCEHQDCVWKMGGLCPRLLWLADRLREGLASFADGGVPVRESMAPVFTGPVQGEGVGEPDPGPRVKPAITKAITYCGQPAAVACDARCDKAWGRQRRPTHSDGSMVGDDALGTAPIDPGTYEGRHAKPRQPWEKPNRWCVRECERCWMSPVGEPNATPVLPTFPSPDR